jgi:subtilisin-like proprotein convertase family protein
MRHLHKQHTYRTLTIAALALAFVMAGWQAPTLFAYSSKAVRSVFTSAPTIPAQPELKSTAASAAVAQQLTKQQKHARMRELLTLIGQLKSQPGQQGALNAAQTELQQISSSLGGDLPANESNGSPGQTGAPVSIIAPAPPNCVLTTVNAANNTATTINDVATVTSTITVAGANPYLWDLNMTTFITHTFAADLDITLTSPAGTVVTITTDNGGGNANVFNGTVWDDQATTPVTDQVYANNVVASPLVVEEAMGAFRGENPNGVWTLTITDDQAGDVGELASWSLQVSALATAPPPTKLNYGNNANLPILDVNTITSNIVIAGAPTSIIQVDLGTFITHTFNADLDITLTSPAGTVVTITTDNGGANDNVFNGTGWEDMAGTPVTDFVFTDNVVAFTLVPEGALAAFQGENPNGTWTLTITDDQAGDVGTLVRWAMEFEATNGCALPCAITCPANQTVKTLGTSAVVNYPPPTTSGQCGAVTCTPPSGSNFPVGTTTVTCVAAGANPVTCAFTVTVMNVPGSISLIDANGGCVGPGDTINGTVSITNNSGMTAASSVSVALPVGLVGVPGTCTANVGSCTVTASTVNWSGTLTNNQTVTFNFKAQVGQVAAGTQLCATVTADLGMPVLGSLQACLTVNCQPKGPGLPDPFNSEMSDQKAGSVLIYNIYTSSTDPTKQNTRINITNANPSRPAFVHLFFVAEGCAVADSYLCLTPNQTASFLASDLDPGTTGYLVAVAVNEIGCPIASNCLIGDEYVKFTTGHEANLGAEAFAALPGGLPLCDGNSVTATLNFDGISYNRTPAVLALSNIGSRADGNDTLLILNRIGGNLGIGAASLGPLFGILYDDAENALSFSVTGGCQLRSSINNNFPRTTPRFETFVPAGRTGWIRIYNQTGAIGMTGAAINFNGNATSSAGAFNQGHNLHALRLNNQMSYIIPVFPPSC